MTTMVRVLRIGTVYLGGCRRYREVWIDSGRSDHCPVTVDLQIELRAGSSSEELIEFVLQHDDSSAEPA